MKQIDSYNRSRTSWSDDKAEGSQRRPAPAQLRAEATSKARRKYSEIENSYQQAVTAHQTRMERRLKEAETKITQVVRKAAARGEHTRKSPVQPVGEDPQLANQLLNVSRNSAGLPSKDLLRNGFFVHRGTSQKAVRSILQH